MKYILAISALLMFTSAASAQIVIDPVPHVRHRAPVVVVPIPRPRPESRYEYFRRCSVHPLMPDCPRGRGYYRGPDDEWDHD